MSLQQPLLVRPELSPDALAALTARLAERAEDYD
eukprot:gene30006-38667_t